MVGLRITAAGVRRTSSWRLRRVIPDNISSIRRVAIDAGCVSRLGLMLLRQHSDGGSLIDPFDFVVIGAGSAGAVLAARASENPDVSVLLIEAGPDHTSAQTPDSIRSANFFAAVTTPGRIWPNLVATRAAGSDRIGVRPRSGRRRLVVSERDGSDPRHS